MTTALILAGFGCEVVCVPIPDEVRTRLLGAIETDALVFLCGAGLSIPAPSSLPTAAVVAKACFDKWLPNEATLDPALEWDLDGLAGLFHGRGDFSTFLGIIPWNELAGASNKGHAAISDLLVTRASHGALSANVDTMIERWANDRKIAMRGALTGQEAEQFRPVSSPLLKFHGCMNRGPQTTVWTQGQLADADVATAIQSCTQWMNLHLPGKHLVVVGFWTDWKYLNDVLADAFTITTAASVTVIDPEPDDVLQAKAPELWDKLNALSHHFVHLQASSDDTLDELRLAFSRKWARQFYALGQPIAAAAGIALVPSPDALTNDQLYDLRRDAEGVPYSQAATHKNPTAAACGEGAFAHIKLLGNGAVQTGAWLTIAGNSVRVVSGAGKLLSAVKQAHREPTTLVQPDIVLCAGATDVGVPAKVVASGKLKSIVAPAPGGTAKWMTFDDAMSEVGL